MVSSTYVFMIQYVIGVPEHFEDRFILLKEDESKVYNMTAYFLAVFFWEVPRAIVQCLIVFFWGFTMVDLNDNIFGALILTLIIGVFAWQGVVALCSFLVSFVIPFSPSINPTRSLSHRPKTLDSCTS